MKISTLSMSLVALTFTACTTVEDDAARSELRSCNAMIDAAHEADVADLPSLTAEMADEGCYDLDLALELGRRLVSETTEEGDARDLVDSLLSLQSAEPHEGDRFRDAGCSPSGKTCIIIIGGGGSCVSSTIGGTTVYVCGPQGVDPNP